MEHIIRDESSYIKISSDDGINWWIDDTYVDPQRRKTGVGRNLVKRAIVYMKARGGQRVGLWAPSPDAFDFWRKMGFNESGVRKL